MNIIPSEHYGTLAEILFPSETGVSVPLLVHLEAEFISPPCPLIKVKSSSDGDERDSGWSWVTVTEFPEDLSSQLSEELLREVREFIRINKETLVQYWHYIPNVTIKELIQRYENPRNYTM